MVVKLESVGEFDLMMRALEAQRIEFDRGRIATNKPDEKQYFTQQMNKITRLKTKLHKTAKSPGNYKKVNLQFAKYQVVAND